jgi:hypothetical protein
MGVREVARYIRVDYNALPPFGHAEGQHLSPFPCMKEEYCSRKDLVLVVLFASIALVGCASNVQLINETATGGTLLYPYVEEQDVLNSPERRDALRLLEEKCPAGYRISREGEVPRIDQVVDRAWMGQISRDGQVSRERHWAILFACK